MVVMVGEGEGGRVICVGGRGDGTGGGVGIIGGVMRGVPVGVQSSKPPCPSRRLSRSRAGGIGGVGVAAGGVGVLVVLGAWNTVGVRGSLVERYRSSLGSISEVVLRLGQGCMKQYSPVSSSETKPYFLSSVSYQWVRL